MPSLSGSATALRDLFPADVLALEASAEMWEGALYPEEEACITRAVGKRRREFTAGRVCARLALARFGIQNFPLISGQDRLPIWPPGIVGSLSHTHDYCAVAIARRGAFAGLGLDVEMAGPLKGRTVTYICRPTEIALLSAPPEFQIPGVGSATGQGVPAVAGDAASGEFSEGDVAKILFSVKEAVYKCLYPLTGMRLDFHDVDVTLDFHAATFTAHVLKDGGAPAGVERLSGRFALDTSHVLSGVALTSREMGLEVPAPWT